MGSYTNGISCEINPLRLIIPLLIFVEKKNKTKQKKKKQKKKQKKKPALYASLIVPCFTWLTCMYTFGYVVQLWMY